MKFCSVLILLISLFALSVSNVHGQDGSFPATAQKASTAQSEAHFASWRLFPCRTILMLVPHGFPSVLPSPDEYVDNDFQMTPQHSNNWSLRFWRLPHLDNLELLHADVTHDYPPHLHEEFSIAVILRGIESITCRGATHEARSGDLLLISAEEVHSNKSVGSEYRLIKVRPQTLERIANELGQASLESCFNRIIVNDPLLFRRFLQLHLKLERNVSTLEQESEFVSTMGLLLSRLNKDCVAGERPANRSREGAPVRLVRDYLKSHYAENVSLSQLTTLTNVSRFHLLRMFHDSAGFPPHEYQTQVRIAHARRLIRRGLTLSQVALETGFFDQSHLSRNFKRIVGVTPRQYFKGKSRLEN